MMNWKRNTNKTIFACLVLLSIAGASCNQPKQLAAKAKTAYPGYNLVWSDEFNSKGSLNNTLWTFEKGFVRNNELQWYQQENAWCENGLLIMEARKENKPNPLFENGSTDWRKSRSHIQYTSSSINTSKSKSWKYGIFEIKAKIPAQKGMWPAFWTLGIEKEWPSNGECDIMEYYKGDLLANVAIGTEKRYTAKWFSVKKPVASFGGEKWADTFHVWKMVWDERFVRLYVDDYLMNEVPVNQLQNPDGFNPFMQPHYILLNLAVGGDNGGDPSQTAFPQRYLIDYVRVYQKK